MVKSGQKEILKKTVSNWKKSGECIGFVPTMGALHEGHLDLVRKARRECGKVLVSIFVNPLQFNNPEDLSRYPRMPEADASLLRAEGVDFLYLPEKEDFYEEPTRMQLDFGAAGRILEGAMRPGHFSGVGVVLSRLFHLTQPDRAYFGAKDLQQVAIVNLLVRDMEFPLTVVRCPTRREANGLAMSSRNLRLSESGRELASELYKALQISLEAGAAKPAASRNLALNHLRKFPEIEVEYLEWVDADTMELWDGSGRVPENAAVCIAARVEGIRLIDNISSAE